MFPWELRISSSQLPVALLNKCKSTVLLIWSIQVCDKTPETLIQHPIGANSPQVDTMQFQKKPTSAAPLHDL